jgi:hypothetical protein
MLEDATPFQMARISIRGGIAAGLLIAVLIGSMLADLPALRLPVLAGIACGLLFGAVWIVARRQRPLDARTPPLSLALSGDHRPPR